MEPPAIPVRFSYVLSARVQPTELGLTTEVAAIAVVLMGAMSTLGYRELAIGLAVVVAALLAYKQPLQGLVEKIGWDDVFAGLRLLIATFVVLPLLPVEAVDPWGAWKPYSLWLLVLLISSLSLIGYVATRWIGAEKGTVLTGISGGLVSSTAVTLTFAKQSRHETAQSAAYLLACGILLAWCIMFGRVLAEVLVVNKNLVLAVLVPFAVMGIVAGVLAWWFYRRSTTSRLAAPAPKAHVVPLKNPFSLTEAVKFAAFFAVVLLVVKLTQRYFPGEGFYVVAALAGLTDVDAITLSMAEYAKSGDPDIAVNSIVIAALSNTAVKCAMVMSLGGAALRRDVFMATAAILIAGLATVLFA
jgi:uncharacterized membrane protein (DUF4010 family)